MNFEQWENRRESHFKQTVEFREMKGFQENIGSRTVSMYYPEEMYTFLQTQYPEAEIKDFYYEVDDEREVLMIQLIANGLYFDCNMYLETFDEEPSLAFIHSVQEHLRFLTVSEQEQIKPILSALFQRMKQFVIEHSPNRLLLLTSDYDEDIPTLLHETER